MDYKHDSGLKTFPDIEINLNFDFELFQLDIFPPRRVPPRQLDRV